MMKIEELVFDYNSQRREEFEFKGGVLTSRGFSNKIQLFEKGVWIRDSFDWESCILCYSQSLSLDVTST